MTRVAYEFSGSLRVMSPLHVGSGDFGVRKAVAGKDGVNQAPEVALLVRDASNRPYLPATSLKGLLRRLGASCDATAGIDVDRLFGTSADGERSKSRMGAVFLRGAVLEAAGDVASAPFVGRDVGGELGPGVFVAARTSIDPDLGITRDALLFFQEMVAPGAVFAFRAVVERTGPQAPEQAERAAREFAAVLRLLTVPEGIAIGKGQSDGFGRVRLDAARMTVARRAVDTEGNYSTRDTSVLWREIAVPPMRRDAAPVRRVRYALSCRGPFVVVDASRRAKRGERTEGDRTPHVRAQRLTSDLPLLMGTGVSGALRARAAWLAALMNLPISPSGEEQIPPSGALERLFGVTGFRGLLTVADLTVAEADTSAVTSVNLDRFSGAPVDNKLFTTEVFVGVRAGLTLELRRRGGVEPTADDVALFEKLGEDLVRNGLQLGHGANKGFGWFEVEEKRDGDR